MSKSLLKMKNDRDAKLTALKDLLDGVDIEKGYSDEERTQRDDLSKEIDQLNEQIRDTENHEQAMRLVAGVSAPSTQEVKELNGIVKKYRLGSAVRHLIKKGQAPSEGVEAEMQQMAEQEARDAGQSISGLGIPSVLIDMEAGRKAVKGHHRADLEVATPATAGVLVDTVLDNQITPLLRPELQMVALGAEVKTGLTSNYSFIRKTSGSSWAWGSEKSSATETNPAYEQVDMTPHRITGYIPMTRRLLIQSDFNVEQEVRRDAEVGIAITADLGGLNGSGLSNQPTGLLNLAIGDVAGGTDGANPSYTNIVNIKKALRTQNVSMRNIAWLSNPEMEATLALTEKFSGTNGMPVLSEQNKVFGYPFAVSTQVPNDLVKGGSSDCCAIILGNWSEAIFAMWGGLDLIYDEITLAKEHMVQLIGHLLMDFNVRHLESFAAMQDARPL